jgi:hypothetical protein
VVALKLPDDSGSSVLDYFLSCHPPKKMLMFLVMLFYDVLAGTVF